jgi:hypothetical protein
MYLEIINNRAKSNGGMNSASNYLIHESHNGTFPVSINALSNVYAKQYAGTGPLTWSITSANPANMSILNIDSNTAAITVSSNVSANASWMSDYITVTTSNVLGHMEQINFNMNVAQTPIIIAPGTLYATGNDILSFSYTFSNLVPPDRCGPLRWDITPLTGFQINPTTGVLTYNFTNITGTQLLDISSTSWVRPP